MYPLFTPNLISMTVDFEGIFTSDNEQACPENTCYIIKTLFDNDNYDNYLTFQKQDFENI